jgi:hypothetical protein
LERVLSRGIKRDQNYSIKGLKTLSPALRSLQDLPYNAEQQRYEAARRADKRKNWRCHCAGKKGIFLPEIFSNIML